MAEKVVLAYSGGLDTSLAIRWLEETYKLKVITLTVDIGNVPDLEAIRQKALKVGAIKAIGRRCPKRLLSSRMSFPLFKPMPSMKGNIPYLQPWDVLSSSVS